MYKLDILRNSDASKYTQFTFPSFRSPLQGNIEANPLIVAIRASDLGQPIGLAIAEIRQSTVAEVLSIFVNPPYRSAGIGTALLIRLEAELALRSCTTAKLVYMAGKPTTPALESLLQTCHWTAPEPRMLVCRGQTEMVVKAPWIQRYSHLPAAYRIFPWVEITPEEREVIQQTQAVHSWIPEDLVPFRYEQNLEPLNSLGLRYQGQVVGWVINHRLDPDTIRYTCSFVREDLQKMGRIISLYAEACKRQANANIPNGIWTVPYIHKAMVNFVKHRWVPYLTSVAETRGSSKLLDAKALQQTSDRQAIAQQLVTS